MATTRLSDAVEVEVYETYQALDSPEKTAFFQSGLVTRNGLLDSIARTGGIMATLPFWNDLDATLEPNYSNDDPADLATPNKITASRQVARKAFMNQGFSSMDLIVELTGSEPMQHIRNRFGTYWMRQFQRRLIASTVGIYNANVAQDSGDMVVNVAGTAGAGGLFNNEAVIRAAGTMGDSSGALTGIAMHSRVRDRALIAGDIVYVPSQDGSLSLPTYKGLTVVVDDNLPVLSGTGDTAQYLTVLMGRGAFGFGEEQGSAFAMGEGVPRVPVEIERNPRAGNGGGEETIWERKTTILHPQGFSWVEPSGVDALVEFSPTLADLRAAANWDRVVNRKNAPFAFLVSRA